MTNLSEFTPMFYPKSVAVIGASADVRKYGGFFLTTLLSFGYKGEVYPVTRQTDEIFGLKAYRTVGDIPAPVDMAVIAVPARYVPTIVEECLAKGIKAAEIITSGFGETGEEGQKLEDEIASTAKKGIRILGPNCFGVYCPAAGLTVMPGEDLPQEGGPVAFISQSGGFAVRVPRRGSGLGIRFSKVVSYGNACDVDESDLLDYLGHDPSTRIITGYIEGVKNGARFFNTLRRVAKAKPVILWKGGLSHSGATAARSHTGSLSGSRSVWSAVFRQSGAIQVHDMEELLDTVLAFLHLPPQQGRRVSVVGGGGAITVTAADTCEQAGLLLPLFPANLQQKLATTIPSVGASARNPVDVGNPYPSPAMLQAVLETITREGKIDTIIVDEIEMSLSGPRAEHFTTAFGTGFNGCIAATIAVKKQLGQPLLMVLPAESTGPETVKFEGIRRQLCQYYLSEGIPVYPTLKRATIALSNMVSYYQHRNALSAENKPSIDLPA